MEFANRSKFQPFAALAVLLMALLVPAVGRAAEQTVSAATLKQWIDTGRAHLIVDVRKPALFEAAHLPGAIGIPADVLPFKPLPKDRDIVLYDNDLSGATARAAAAKLASVDAARVFLLQGGLRGWEAAGFDALRPAGLFDPTMDSIVTAEDVREAIRIGIPLQVLDVRDTKSFGKGTLPGATNVPLLKDAETLKGLKSDSLAAMVALPESSTKQLKAESGGDHSAPSPDAVAAALAQQLAAATRKKGKSAGPVVVLDDSGILARKMVPRLKRYGLEGALTLENGYAGWKSLQAPGPAGRDTIYHGGSSVPLRQPSGS